MDKTGLTQRVDHLRELLLVEEKVQSVRRTKAQNSPGFRDQFADRARQVGVESSQIVDV